MTAAQRIDSALQVALNVTVDALTSAEITPHQAQQVLDLVGAAVNTVQQWAPEWETAVEL